MIILLVQTSFNKKGKKMFGIGQPELILIIFILLLLFGSETLPKMSRTLGDSLRSLRDGFSGGERNKSFKDITSEVASSAREIRSSIDEIKNPLSGITNTAPAAETPAPEQKDI